METSQSPKYGIFGSKLGSKIHYSLKNFGSFLEIFLTRLNSYKGVDRGDILVAKINRI